MSAVFTYKSDEINNITDHEAKKICYTLLTRWILVAMLLMLFLPNEVLIEYEVGIPGYCELRQRICSIMYYIFFFVYTPYALFVGLAQIVENNLTGRVSNPYLHILVHWERVGIE